MAWALLWLPGRGGRCSNCSNTIPAPPPTKQHHHHRHHESLRQIPARNSSRQPALPLLRSVPHKDGACTPGYRYCPSQYLLPPPPSPFYSNSGSRLPKHGPKQTSNPETLTSRCSRVPSSARPSRPRRAYHCFCVECCRPRHRRCRATVSRLAPPPPKEAPPSVPFRLGKSCGPACPPHLTAYVRSSDPPRAAAAWPFLHLDCKFKNCKS